MAQRAPLNAKRRVGAQIKNGMVLWCRFIFLSAVLYSLCKKRVRAQIKNGLVFWYRSFISEHNSNLYSLCEKRVGAQIKNGLVLWHSFIFLCAIEVIYYYALRDI